MKGTLDICGAFLLCTYLYESSVTCTHLIIWNNTGDCSKFWKNSDIVGTVDIFMEVNDVAIQKMLKCFGKTVPVKGCISVPIYNFQTEACDNN